MKNNLIKAIIVDDMVQAQQALYRDLQQTCPDIDVIGYATGVIGAAKLLRENTPDVLFLDIELEDGTGFDLLEILPEINFKIIFTTASDQHAIKAFRFSAIDYLLKPIDLEALKEAVDKIAKRDSKDKVEVLLDHWSPSGKSRRLTLQNSDKIEIVTVDDIVRCEAENNYTTFIFADGSKFLVSQTMKTFEKILEPIGFFRSHQSHLINLQSVKAYVKTEGGYLVMTNGDRVPVAVRKKAKVVELLTRDEF